MDRIGKADRDAAFTAFVERATPSLLRTAWLLTGNHDIPNDTAENLNQETDNGTAANHAASRPHLDVALTVANTQQQFLLERTCLSHNAVPWPND